MKDEIIEKKKVKGPLIFPDKRIVFENDCVVGGDIEAASIIAERNLIVKGNVISKSIIFFKRNAKVYGMIAAQEEINGMRDITAKKSIHSGKSIQLEGTIKSRKGSITATGKISAKKGIRAGSWIIAKSVITDGNIKSKDYIRAKEIYAGEDKVIYAKKIFGEIKSGFWEKNKES